MKNKLVKLAGALALLAATVTSPAQTVTYTLTGNVDGWVGGYQMFNDAFTLTTVADLSDIISGSFNPGPGNVPYYIISGTTTFKVSGTTFDHATITDPSFGLVMYDLNAFAPGVGQIYFMDTSTATTSMKSLVTIGGIPSTYDLSSPLSLSSVTLSVPGAPPTFSTDQAGPLQLTRIFVTGAVSFAPEAVPTPEPSTLVLAGLGGASLLLFRRRK